MAFLNTAYQRIIRSVIWSLPAQICLLLACLLLAGIAGGQEKRSDVYAVMAVYTYNFAKFTHWPPASIPVSGSSLNLCLLGEDPFGMSLSQLEGKTVKNHTLHIRRYPRVAVLADCHIVFVSRSEDWRLDTILRELAQAPILTVSDIPDFARRGGMIALQIVEQRVRFSINTAATAQAGLQLSSKLLELAQIVD
ncbi:MAG: YfiR family protein [Gammaproteobacteria bacterium]